VIALQLAGRAGTIRLRGSRETARHWAFGTQHRACSSSSITVHAPWKCLEGMAAPIGDALLRVVECRSPRLSLLGSPDAGRSPRRAIAGGGPRARRGRFTMRRGVSKSRLSATRPCRFETSAHWRQQRRECQGSEGLAVAMARAERFTVGHQCGARSTHMGAALPSAESRMRKSSLLEQDRFLQITCLGSTPRCRC